MDPELKDRLIDELLRERADLPIAWLGWLRIQGIEVTQATQHYRAAAHLTDTADQGADNSVRLIAGKPAWVRVYVRVATPLVRKQALLFNMPGVTGEIELMRRHLGFHYHTITTLSPQPPGTVTARRFATYSTERGTLSYTLNFIVPADLMCGRLRFKVRISAPGGESDEHSYDLDVTLRQTLRLAGIMVGYNGPSSSAPGAPNLTLAAPTITDMQTTSAWTLLTFPVRSNATYRSAGTVTWNLPLTDAPSCPGCCTPNWVALNSAVQAQRVADGNRTDVLYYGLMAPGIPMGPVIGCNSGGVSTGSNGDGVTMAHELGHACGLPHAPCGTPGDPNYPAYEPYDPAGTPQASIGEYGLDVSNGNIFSPATFKDFMSYCGPRWISRYNYGRLTNNASLDPVTVCNDLFWWRDYILFDPLIIPEKWLPDPPPDPVWRQREMPSEPLISIIGAVHADNDVRVGSVVRLAALREVPSGTPTEMVAELVGDKGEVIARAPVYSLRSQAQGGCGCGGKCGPEAPSYPYVFQAFVPDVALGVALRIRSGDKELWRRDAPESEPRIASFSARHGRGDQIACEWQVKAKGKTEPEFWLQWSEDGRVWQGLASCLRGREASVDGRGLPSGKVSLRLLASDGFHTAVSKSVAVEVPRRGPAVAILAPRAGETLLAGRAMRLWAAISGRDADDPKAKVRWLLDGKRCGDSPDLVLNAPEAGEHKLTLQVSTAEGTSEHRVEFRTIVTPEGEGEE